MSSFGCVATCRVQDPGGILTPFSFFQGLRPHLTQFSWEDRVVAFLPLALALQLLPGKAGLKLSSTLSERDIPEHRKA